VGFNFHTAFGRPVKLINDAAMQAIGSYKGGRMLFLGLGTGLGTAMVVDGIVQPMELAHLPYKKGKTYEDYLGLRGLERMGKKKWRRTVARVTGELRAALDADYVVLGGGNSKKLKKLPPKTRFGDNRNAFIGGFRLWGQGKNKIRTSISLQSLGATPSSS
jgi:predicted NBD/HSP70 family sugar kinase